METSTETDQMVMLIAKARGFVTALSQQTAKEREDLPTRGFGEDYNTLRKMAIDAFPDLESYMPPHLGFARRGYGGLVTLARYAEVHAYAEQIVELLNSQHESRHE